MSDDFDWAPFEGNRWGAENVGDELIGQILKLRTEQDRKGNPMPVLTVREKESDRELEVWAPMHLRQVLAEQKPQVDDLIAMKLVELRRTGQPNPMKVFAVKVKKGEPSPVEVEDVPTDEPF